MKNLTSQHTDSLVYLDDYIDTIEALPLELQRNFSLLREMDGYAQDLVATVAKDSIDMINNVSEMDPSDRIERLKQLGDLLTETLKRGEEKVALAKTTFDAVERHCNRLDANLVKFEEANQLGRDRITTQPGLAPSARNLLREVIRDKASRGYDRDRKDGKGDKRATDQPSAKKQKVLKEATSPLPGSLRSQALKESKLIKTHTDKTAMNTGKKAKNAVPADLPIDPDEPLYCYCQQVSYGEMVACDNMGCEIEWFHLACVGRKTVPKGEWYCNKCSSKMKSKQRK